MPTIFFVNLSPLLFSYSSGQVSVQLRNVGTDAYKHAVYGDSIIVERKITAEGGSSYKIKSSEGKTQLAIFSTASF